VIDAVRGLLSVELSPGELKKRSFKKPKQSLSGVLEKYAAQVGSAFRGAVTHSGPRK
jgi:dihydroxyacid dehydratase/phosphogluconate dehydratase